MVQHLNASYIYHNYEHPVHDLYKHEVRQQAQIVAKPMRENPLKNLNILSNN